MSTVTHSIPFEVASHGGITLSPEQVRALGFGAGERLVIVPLESQRYMLMKADVPDRLSHAELSELLKTSFAQAGYETEASVIALVRDVKREMAAEW